MYDNRHHYSLCVSECLGYNFIRVICLQDSLHVHCSLLLHNNSLVETSNLNILQTFLVQFSGTGSYKARLLCCNIGCYRDPQSFRSSHPCHGFLPYRSIGTLSCTADCKLDTRSCQQVAVSNIYHLYT